MDTHVPMTAAFVDLPAGPRLEYVRWGVRGRPPVLLLHGLSDAWPSFEPMKVHLVRDVDAVAPSQRGHGRSGRPAAGYRAADFARDAVALIDALDLPPVVVVGHSLGSVVALQLAVDAPDRVLGVIGIGPAAHFGANADVRALHDEVATMSDPIDRAFVQAFQAGTAAEPLPPPLLERMVDQSMLVPARVWRDTLAALVEEDLGDRLHALKVPVALLRGSLDAISRAEDVERLRGLVPHATVETWDGIGHSPNWEVPRRCARFIVDFAARVADGRAGVGARAA